VYVKTKQNNCKCEADCKTVVQFCCDNKELKYLVGKVMQIQTCTTVGCDLLFIYKLGLATINVYAKFKFCIYFQNVLLLYSQQHNNS